MLKEKLWIRRIHIEAKVIILRENQVVEETTLLKVIQRNNTREQELLKESEKDNEQAWEEDGIVYIEGMIYVLNNWKI